jgi:hypothetical protein
MEAAMMNMANEAVAVASPVTGLMDLGSAIDELAQLQKRASEIEKRARVLRGEVKEGLVRYGVRKFATATGHTATWVESTSWRGSKEDAERLLDPVTVAEIFKPTTNTSIRIK